MGVGVVGEPGKGILRLGGRSPNFEFFGLAEDSISTPDTNISVSGGTKECLSAVVTHH